MRLGSGEWGTRPGQPLFLRKGQMSIPPALASEAIQWFGSVPLAKCTEPLFLRKGQMRIPPALASEAIQWFGSVALAKCTEPLFLRKGQMSIPPAIASEAIQWFGSVALAKCTEPLFLRKGQMSIPPALASGAIQWFGSVPLAKRTGPFNTMSVVEALRGSSLPHSCDQLSDKFGFQYSKVVQEYATEIGVQLLFVATCVSYRMHSEAFDMMLYAIFTMMDSWTSRSHPRHDVLR